MINYPAFETIKKRKSIRTYSDEIVQNDLIEKITNFIDTNDTGPFNTKLKYQIIDKNSSKAKLGTYGFISGAKKYLVFYAEKKNYNWLDIGFIIEDILLYCTSLGIGTCWIGGTFNRSNLSKQIFEDENYFIPIITPLGIEKKSRTFRDKIIRGASKGDSRFNIEKILINNKKEKYLNSEKYLKLLEMIRLAPSASNKQPWRIEIEENKFNFYLQRTKGYSKIIPEIDLQKIDIGISLCHFYKAVEEMNIPVLRWLDNEKKQNGMEYQISLEVDLSGS